MENTNKKGRPGGTGATHKPSAYAFDSTPLSRSWRIAKHLAHTLPFECAGILALLLLAAFTAAGVTL